MVDAIVCNLNSCDLFCRLLAVKLKLLRHDAMRTDGG
jgi:hypothetical protein